MIVYRVPGPMLNSFPTVSRFNLPTTPCGISPTPTLTNEEMSLPEVTS